LCKPDSQFGGRSANQPFRWLLARTIASLIGANVWGRRTCSTQLLDTGRVPLIFRVCFQFWYSYVVLIDIGYITWKYDVITKPEVRHYN